MSIGKRELVGEGLNMQTVCARTGSTINSLVVATLPVEGSMGGKGCQRYRQTDRS